jgi:hypothetical protein
MKPLTQEWVDKAEGDFATASREIRARKAPNMMRSVFTLSNVLKNISKQDFRKKELHSRKHII